MKCRAVWVLQRFVRWSVLGFRLEEKIKAARQIQLLWRAYNARMNFIHTLADISIVQSVARRRITLHLVTPLISMRRLGSTPCLIELREWVETDDKMWEDQSVSTAKCLKAWR